MICIDDYSSIMTETLKEGESGIFCLKKKVMLAGTLLTMFDKNKGMYKDRTDKDFEIIQLRTKDGDIWMSNEPFEQECYHEPIRNATGRVLVGGLGIGMLPFLIKDKLDVTKIDVVEKEYDVINLVWNQIRNEKMEIIKDGIYHFIETTDRRYDFIHIDIWADFATTYDEIYTTIKKAQKLLNPNGKIMCWLEENYEIIKDLIPKEPVSNGQLVFTPCKMCGKIPHVDYGGFCMDCMDACGKSELFIKKQGVKGVD